MRAAAAAVVARRPPPPAPALAAARARPGTRQAVQGSSMCGHCCCCCCRCACVHWRTVGGVEELWKGDAMSWAKGSVPHIGLARGCRRPYQPTTYMVGAVTILAKGASSQTFLLLLHRRRSQSPPGERASACFSGCHEGACTDACAHDARMCNASSEDSVYTTAHPLLRVAKGAHSCT